MNFIVSTPETSFDSIEKLYTAPLKTVGYKLKVAALAFFLIVSSMNEDAYGAESHSRQGNKQTTEFVDSWGETLPVSHLSGLQLEFNKSIYKLFTRQVSTFWQRQESLNKLRVSFFANFDEGQTDINRFSPLFRTMATQLSQLRIEDAFVDVSRKKDLIDFNLNLKNGYFLSVAKNIDDSDDNVMFAIAKDQHTLVIDEMPLADLIREVEEIVA